MTEQAERRGRERQQVSPAEVALLASMLNLGLDPLQQVPIGPYDLDFYFPKERFCVEVDGRHHQYQATKDTRRDEYLRKRHIDTLRLAARLTFHCSDECATLISIILGYRRQGRPYPVGLTGRTVGILEELRESRIREWELKRPWR